MYTLLFFLGLGIVATICVVAILCVLLIGIHEALRGIHTLATTRRATERIVEIITTIKPDAVHCYELGCGKASVSIALRKRFPTMLLTGIEFDRFQLTCARLNVLLHRQSLRLIHGNLFEKDVHDGDIFYAYLPRPLLPALEAKLWRECTPGAIVITNTSHFESWKPSAEYLIDPKNQQSKKLFVHIKK